MKDRNVSSVRWRITVRDKSGKVIEQKEGKGDSVLDNWIKLFESIKTGTAWTPNDTSGSSCSISNLAITSCAGHAPAGDDDYGILVGTGTDPVDITDYQLASKISHGTGSGQLSYGETSSYTDGSGLQQDRGMQRSFDNNSGADITIKEIGMVLKINDGSSDYYIMVMRDVISDTTVPNGGRVTIEYWFRWNPS